eukprot:1140354-Pelagomonas_calceolata.AAC.2
MQVVDMVMRFPPILLTHPEITASRATLLADNLFVQDTGALMQTGNPFVQDAGAVMQTGNLFVEDTGALMQVAMRALLLYTDTENIFVALAQVVMRAPWLFIFPQIVQGRDEGARALHTLHPLHTLSAGCSGSGCRDEGTLALHSSTERPGGPIPEALCHLQRPIKGRGPIYHREQSSPAGH